MTRDEVIAKLRAHRAELEAMRVTSVALFGSVARGEAGPESDVDILVEVGGSTTYFDLARLERRVAEILQSKVDLLTREELHPALKDRIIREVVDAWS